MKGLIRASLTNPYAVIVMSLAIAVLGSLSLMAIPIDILPVFNSIELMPIETQTLDNCSVSRQNCEDWVKIM